MESRTLLIGLALPMLAMAAPSRAEDGETGALAIEAEYIADITSVARGPQTGTRFTDLLSVSADLPLDRDGGWEGAGLFAHGQIGFGGEPNRLAGTLQGINNSELTDNRARLFEIYLEQAFAGPLPGSLRLGYSDLNSEFYANEPAGLLIAPAFGIGSELAATGQNGPSIFPSSALTARLRLDPAEGAYVQAAIVDARAGVLGDRDGPPSPFRAGTLAIAEASLTRGARIAVGAWRYGRRQEAIDGGTARWRARGVYLLADVPMGKTITAFLRAGISDGRTSPYRSGWQAGFLANGVLAGRPESQLSFGIAQGVLGHPFRRASAASGEPFRRAETGYELTFADRIAPWLTVQPAVQYVRNASRAAHSRDAVVFTLRLRFAWSGS